MQTLTCTVKGGKRDLNTGTTRLPNIFLTPHLSHCPLYMYICKSFITIMIHIDPKTKDVTICIVDTAGCVHILAADIYAVPTCLSPRGIHATSTSYSPSCTSVIPCFVKKHIV